MNVHFGPLESRDFGEGLRLKFRNRRESKALLIAHLSFALMTGSYS